MFIGFPVLKDVSIPFLVIGADGSVPFSGWPPILTLGGAKSKVMLIKYTPRKDYCTIN